MKRFVWIVTSLILIVSMLSMLRQQAVRSQNETIEVTVTQTPVSPVPVAESAATPTSFAANPFNYTPLPVDNGGPENDIVEYQPLTASRPAAQVDDFITFTAGIKNVAPYKKSILSLCFESSDGNFGCVWGIELLPGQTYSLQNVGSWISGGTKTVWITWTQNGQTYYRPKGSKAVSVTIIG